MQLVRMASEDTLNMMIEDKVTSLKEELEEMIEEVKNDVDDRGSELVSNRELQNQSFNKLDKSMDKLRKELKQFGKSIIIMFIVIIRPIISSFYKVAWAVM